MTTRSLFVGSSGFLGAAPLLAGLACGVAGCGDSGSSTAPGDAGTEMGAGGSSVGGAGNGGAGAGGAGAGGAGAAGTGGASTGGASGSSAGGASGGAIDAATDTGSDTGGVCVPDSVLLASVPPGGGSSCSFTFSTSYQSGLVNLLLTPGWGTVCHAGSSSNCGSGASSDGWWFVSDTEIALCDSTCTRFYDQPAGRLTLQLGCPTESCNGGGGSGGTSGSGGTGGTSGSGGTGGTSGSGGTGGTSGSAGTGGTSGSGGATMDYVCDATGGTPGSCQSSGPFDTCGNCIQSSCCSQRQACLSRNPNDPCGFGGPSGFISEAQCFQRCFRMETAGGASVQQAHDTCSTTCVSPGCTTISTRTTALMSCLETYCLSQCLS